MRVATEALCLVAAIACSACASTDEVHRLESPALAGEFAAFRQLVEEKGPCASVEAIRAIWPEDLRSVEDYPDVQPDCGRRDRLVGRLEWSRGIRVRETEFRVCHRQGSEDGDCEAKAWSATLVRGFVDLDAAKAAGDGFLESAIPPTAENRSDAGEWKRAKEFEGFLRYAGFHSTGQPRVFSGIASVKVMKSEDPPERWRVIVEFVVRNSVIEDLTGQ